MPLPTAPSKRASLLSQKDFDASATARPRHKSGPGSQSADSDPTPVPAVAVTAAVPRAAIAPLPRTAKTPAPAPTAAVTAAPEKTPTRQAARVKASRKVASGPSKLFVLDTNVLLHDPTCLFRFEEHDIFLPMIVLEELDAHKKGMTEVARNGRQTSRTLDALAEHQGADIATGLPLDATGHTEARGRLFFQTQLLDYELPSSLPQGKADNQILGVVQALRKQHAPREVVLVSKDINMRVKARALGLHTDDYQNDKTLDDGDLLYSGALALPADFWTTPRQHD
jgi:PhoH-like ATPase